MNLNGLEIPGNCRKVATFKRNGGNFAPESASDCEYSLTCLSRSSYHMNYAMTLWPGITFAISDRPTSQRQLMMAAYENREILVSCTGDCIAGCRGVRIFILIVA